MMRTVAACSYEDHSWWIGRASRGRIACHALSLLSALLVATCGASEPLSRAPEAALYAERSAAIAIERSKRLLQGGQVIDAVAQLQQILDAPSDTFIELAEGRTGARQAAVTLMSSLPNGEQRIHETMQAAAAKAALEHALSREDSTGLRDVLQRFATTEAGFQAANRLAMTAFDRGDVATAARLWDGLMRNPSHSRRVTPSVAARMLLALRRSGRDGRASELAIVFSGQAVQFEGKSSTIGELLQSVEAPPTGLPTTGTASTAANGLTPPAFPPLWHREPDDLAKNLFEMWQSSHRSEGRPLAMAAGAVFTPDSVIVRDLNGLAAFDLQSGEPAWEAPLMSIVGKSAEEGSHDIHSLANLEERYASNGVYSRISADEERVYVIERHDRSQGAVRTASHSPSPAYERPPVGDASNRLLAYAIDKTMGEQREPCWVAGQSNGSEHSALREHYFLGAPLSTGAELVVITEHQQQLNLVSLEPQSGKIRWLQPLGFVPRSISNDSIRAANPCQPAVSEGIAVCATNSGFIVAYDILAGRLLWAYEYGAESSAKGGGDGSGDQSRSYGDSSFPSPIVIRGRDVLILPPDSQQLHCLDLLSGRQNWAIPREDALYIACATDVSAVVVGRAVCRAHSLASGSALWTSRVGTPSGTGVVTDSSYVLPLEDGTIVAVDMSSGRPVGFDVPRTGSAFEPAGVVSTAEYWRPGNLFAVNDTLVSLGAAGLTRLRPASSTLASAAPADELELARLELAAGELEPARARLLSLIEVKSDSTVSTEATMLLRELNYLRLKWEPLQKSQEILSELDRLSVTPTERGRFILQAADHDLAFNDLAALENRARALSELDLVRPIPKPSDPTHLVTAASWLPQISRTILNNNPERDFFSSKSSVSPVNEQGLLRLLQFEPNSAESARVLMELAQRAALDGNLHEAELLLLRASRSPGFREETAYELSKIVQLSGLSLPKTGEELDDTIHSVQVKARLWAPASDRMCQTFGRSRRGFLTRSQDPIRIVDRGDSRQARLAIVDLAGGVCLGEYELESRLRFPALSRQSTRGHFIPVATSSRVYGLSLLEASQGKPVWEQELPEHDGLLPQIGPYGPSFCTIQTRRELTVIDPRNGSIIWQRIQLPPDRGLNGDHAVGLFGDSEVLALLDSDGVSYTTFSTETGERVSRGELPIDHRRQRRAYGRRLFFVESTERGSFARLWDPATQSYDIDIPFDGRLLQTSTREDNLALLFPNGRLLIHNPETNSALIDIQLDPSEVADAHTIQVFADEACFYVSLYQIDPDRFESSKVAHYVYDTPLSTTHVQGRLVAIDKQSSEVRWIRSTDQRSIIDPVEHVSPFLIAIARISDSKVGNRKTFLVEVIDKRTGVVLGRNDALLPDQILQCIWNNDRDCVELTGLTSTIVLDYGNRPLGNGQAVAFDTFR